MGIVAALISKEGRDASLEISLMLESTSRIDTDFFGIGSSKGTRIKRKVEDLGIIHSNAILGHGLAKITPLDQPGPIFQHGYAMIFEGRLWEGNSPDLVEAAGIIGSKPEDGLLKLVSQNNGSYIVIIAEKGRIICCRDPVGVVPLYIGESDRFLGAASNRKMLHRIGIENTELLLPGSICELNDKEITIRSVQAISKPPTLSISREEAVKKLDDLLNDSVRDRTKGLFSASLGFSGGVDSALLGHYMKGCGIRADLICVGLEGSEEFKVAEKVADCLDLPIRMETFEPSDVEWHLDTVLTMVEEPDPMKVSIAIPTLWAAQGSYRYGNRVFFSGNGSDELFGGYLKYVLEYAESPGKAGESMFRDVTESHSTNFDRDYKVCSDSGVELRLPFADPNLIEFGLSLPIELRLSRDRRKPRKPLLRALAMELGLSDEVITRQKRAFQYSTGVNDQLKRLAKREGKNISQYLGERLEKIKERW